ncbi:hypothetical protein NDU88_007224 [Pleurodeles waltl]|uniref:Uncharacterized protein n=1 Tax=Pleurodeles waltl TaxID=8319 RepID=A0AAV7P094_PLEWA|nr:hypothetical protein NDU88_007224 [Pleurodeles waltl]
MVLSELALRLNNADYKNWVKAGHCLLLLKRSLEGFVGSQMKSFHRRLLSESPVLGRGRQRCTGHCRAQGRQFQPRCSVCAEWKKQILNHHMNRNGEVHWGNCKPSNFSTNYWELAKAYMPRGQTDKQGPDKCDAAALLNLIHFCTQFKYVDQRKVQEVIKGRNELMHSSEMKVSSEWLEDFGKQIQNVIREFHDVPDIKAIGTRIDKVLASDWDVQIPGDDDVDGLHVICGISMEEVEMELLREKLQEMYDLAEEQDILSDKDLISLEKLKNFIKDSKDLKESLAEDLQKLESLEEEMHSPICSLKEGQQEDVDPEEEECVPCKRKCDA